MIKIREMRKSSEIILVFLLFFCAVTSKIGFAAGSLANLTSINWKTADKKEAALVIEADSPLTYKDLTQFGTLHVVIELENSARGNLPPFFSSSIPAIRQVFIAQIKPTTTQIIITLEKTFPYSISVLPKGLAIKFQLTKPLEKSGPGAGNPPPGTYPEKYEVKPGETTEVIPVHYADVSEIVGILTGKYITPASIFTPVTQPLPTLSQAGYMGTPGMSQPQGAVSVPSLTGEPQSMGMRIDDHLAVDKRVNAIIVTGSSDYIEQVRELISKVDVPVPTILLETRILEISENGSKALGVNWIADPLFSLAFQESPGQNGLPGNQSAVANPYGTTPPVLLPGLNPNPFLRNPFQFQAAISALIQKGEAKVLAQPRILTLDGINANIITGNQIPIVSTVTPGFGLPVTSQVQYITVGVDLQVLPHVNSDGYITTSIYAQVSSVTGYQTTSVGGTIQSNPIIASRSTQTMAMVKDGDTIVIGGLLQTQDIKQKNMIPLLGEIPILGALFQFSSTTHQKTDLVILITPHVVKP